MYLSQCFKGGSTYNAWYSCFHWLRGTSPVVGCLWYLFSFMSASGIAFLCLESMAILPGSPFLLDQFVMFHFHGAWSHWDFSKMHFLGGGQFNCNFVSSFCISGTWHWRFDRLLLHLAFAWPLLTDWHVTLFWCRLCWSVDLVCHRVSRFVWLLFALLWYVLFHVCA